MSHVTSWLSLRGFLWISSLNRLSVSHIFWDTELQRFWDQDFFESLDVMWLCHNWTRIIWFPVGCQFKPIVSLVWMLRYGALKVSRSWPFRVKLCHQSRDRWTCNTRFPIGGLLKPTLYLTWLLRYFCVKHLAKNIPVENASISIFMFLGQNRGL